MARSDTIGQSITLSMGHENVVSSHPQELRHQNTTLKDTTVGSVSFWVLQNLECAAFSPVLLTR